jgi:hypothetical protein
MPAIRVPAVSIDRPELFSYWLTQDRSCLLLVGCATALHYQQLDFCNCVSAIKQNYYPCKYGTPSPESVATLPPFSPIEGQKWFDQISSQ